MNWFSGLVLFVVIWWTALFAVLPLGTNPVQRPDDVSGWRGAPERPRLLMKVCITTVLTAVIWCAAVAVIRSDYLGFRHGVLAIPEDRGF